MATVSVLQRNDVAEGREELEEDEVAISYVEGDVYDEVKLASCARSLPVLLNSILLVPNLLSSAECGVLMADVERCHDVFLSASRGESPAHTVVQPTHVTPGRSRYKIRDLGDDSKRIFKAMFYSRLLPFLSTQPAIEQYIWTQSLPASEPNGKDLSKLSFYFAENEPAVNRYIAGGEFEPHSDSHAITVNILLGSGTFSGGGTQFWRENESGEGPTLDQHGSLGQPTVCIHPLSGVGMVWNGNVMHAGAATTQGLRHLLVASFTISARHGFG